MGCKHKNMVAISMSWTLEDKKLEDKIKTGIENEVECGQQK